MLPNMNADKVGRGGVQKDQKWAYVICERSLKCNVNCFTITNGGPYKAR